MAVRSVRLDGNMKKWWQAIMVLTAGVVLGIAAKHYEYPDIQISHVEEILIPGLEGEYELLFLTDLHLALNTRGDAGVYGDADARIRGFSNVRGTVSAKQLPQWIAYANQENLDAVLMGGDMIDYYTDENVALLKHEIEKLNMPYLFTLGNHELFSPWEEAVPVDASLYELFQEKNTAFQILDFGEFVVCGVDNEAYDVNEAALIQIRQFLEANPKKPMIVVAHVPFYTEMNRSLLDTSIGVWGQALVIGEGEGTRDTTSVSREFLELILSEESPVVAIFTGDNHFYHKGELTDKVTQWVAAPAYAGDGMLIRVKGK